MNDNLNPQQFESPEAEPKPSTPQHAKGWQVIAKEGTKYGRFFFDKTAASKVADRLNELSGDNRWEVK